MGQFLIDESIQGHALYRVMDMDPDPHDSRMVERSVFGHQSSEHCLVMNLVTGTDSHLRCHDAIDDLVQCRIRRRTNQHTCRFCLLLADDDGLVEIHQPITIILCICHIILPTWHDGISTSKRDTASHDPWCRGPPFAFLTGNPRSQFHPEIRSHFWRPVNGDVLIDCLFHQLQRFSSCRVQNNAQQSQDSVRFSGSWRSLDQNHWCSIESCSQCIHLRCVVHLFHPFLHCLCEFHPSICLSGPRFSLQQHISKRQTVYVLQGHPFSNNGRERSQTAQPPWTVLHQRCIHLPNALLLSLDTRLCLQIQIKPHADALSPFFGIDDAQSVMRASSSRVIRMIL